MPNITGELTHIERIDTWNSGGGVMLDILELEGGLAVVVGEETISVYRSVDDFWAETEGEGQKALTVILRSTGELFEITGQR